MKSLLKQNTKKYKERKEAKYISQQIANGNINSFLAVFLSINEPGLKGMIKIELTRRLKQWRTIQPSVKEPIILDLLFKQFLIEL